MSRPVVLKIGGELIEGDTRRASMAATIARAIERMPQPLVVVHGGGREVDTALRAAGIPKRQVDGLRVTDAATLDIVLGVLAGRINTAFVAALNAAGVAAVGLTGADACIGVSTTVAPHRTAAGELVDLGLVGEPSPSSDRRLFDTLTAAGFVPVVASIGATRGGDLLNVNADTLAAHVAATVSAERLIIAGATNGVLDPEGRSIPLVDADALTALIADGTATTGMVAKLRACERALAAGVRDILIVDGRDHARLVSTIAADAGGRPRLDAVAYGTSIVAASAAGR